MALLLQHGQVCFTGGVSLQGIGLTEIVKCRLYSKQHSVSTGERESVCVGGRVGVSSGPTAGVLLTDVCVGPAAGSLSMGMCVCVCVKQVCCQQTCVCA